VIKLGTYVYLRNLYLTSDEFEQIEDNTFINLNHLTSLDISQNRIRGNTLL